MKLSGSMFKNAMTTNRIITDGAFVTIHNTENDYGIISRYDLEKEAEHTEITLNKKDFHTLSMLDSFDLKVDGQKINIKTKNGKMVLVNMVDTHMLDTDLSDDAKQLNVKPKDFLPGERFVGNDGTRIQLNGVNITPTGYLISNSKCIFMRKADTGVDKPICVSKEAFKFIADAETCMTDGKRAAFMNPSGQVFYTSLMVQADDMPKFDIKHICAVTLDKRQLVDTLKMFRGYSAEVNIIWDKGLHLLNYSETNAFNIAVDGELTKGSKLDITVYIDDVLKIVDLEDEPKILLSFNDRMLIYNKDETTALCAYINQPNREVA